MQVLSFVIFGLSLFTATHVAAVDWPQFGFDPQHSGNNSQETMLGRNNVATLRPLYHVVLPAIADGAPAFVANVATAGGSKDLLFLTTKAGHLLALDAQTGTTVWSHRPATGPAYTTSSPAVDPTRQYVYGYGLEGRVHKYLLGDGTETVTGGWPQVATLKPDVEKGSAALAIATAQDGSKYLYVANGGYPGDAGDYQGHITAINLTSGAQIVFNTACSDQSLHFREAAAPDCAHVQSAVWARAGVVYDPTNDRIYFATGNGTFDANVGGFDWGDSIIALAPAANATSGLPLDSYTPPEFQQLQNADADLGSSAPAILPTIPASRVAHLGVQMGKDAQIRLVNLDDLSGHGGPGHVGGELQKIAVPQGGGVLTQPAVWLNPTDSSVWIFVSNGSGAAGLQLVVDDVGNPSLVTRWMSAAGGSSPVIANGLLYYARSGHVSALDPVSGQLLWTDSSIGAIHWESPIVVGGRLYVTDENSMLWAYQPVPLSAILMLLLD
jgi:outer membrane protein assembly factor BamB